MVLRLLILRSGPKRIEDEDKFDFRNDWRCRPIERVKDSKANPLRKLPTKGDAPKRKSI
jgi:hypothetical protein